MGKVYCFFFTAGAIVLSPFIICVNTAGIIPYLIRCSTPDKKC